MSSRLRVSSAAVDFDHGASTKNQYKWSYRLSLLTETAPAPQACALGKSLCAVGRLSFTPVRILTVTGMSPRAYDMPLTIFPSLVPMLSTTNVNRIRAVGTLVDLRALPAPCWYTKSIGQPQLRSTKSILPSHCLPMTSAVLAKLAGVLPAIWTPKMRSEGCRRTSDHSSFEP